MARLQSFTLLNSPFHPAMKAHMTAITQEIVNICGALPDEQLAEVADFARFLLARQQDDAWEQRLHDPKPRPRLEQFLHDAASEGDEPLDPSRL
jgi:hypothetical protein